MKKIFLIIALLAVGLTVFGQDNSAFSAKYRVGSDTYKWRFLK
jgi:hypothetical protein